MGDDQIGSYISRSVQRCGRYWSSRNDVSTCSEVWVIMEFSYWFFPFLRLFKGVGDIGGLVSVCYGVYVARPKSSIAATIQAVAVGTYGPTMVSLLSAAPQQKCVDVAAVAEEGEVVDDSTWTVVATREHRDAL